MADPDPQPQPQPQPRGSVPEVFSREYVTELREEAQTYRTRLREAEGKLTEAEKRAKEADTAAQGKIAEATTAAQQRVIRAELRAAAKDAGAIDAADVVALLGTAKVKLDDAGEVTNAAELLADLKKAKPHLFSTSTSSGAKEPKSGDPTPKKAAEMTDDEYAAARAKLLGRR